MKNIIEVVKRNSSTVVKLLPILSFVAPFLILYSLYPSSFEATWKGRTFYLFFLWLVFLETVLEWESVRANKLTKLKQIRTVMFIIALLLPTVYVVAANYFGLNAVIGDFAARNNVSPEFVDLVPLSTEYLVFTALIALIVLLGYGTICLKTFSISTIFLGMIGIIYTIDNLYPWGRFAPFQIFVPVTSTLAANVLTMMGYKTSVSFMENDPKYGSLTLLQAEDLHGRTAGFYIAWACSGVESLLIYSVTILLFLKNSLISWKQRIAYFVFGAVVTFLINIMRIVTIFVIAIDTGGYTHEVQRFHDYYGQLYSITWIVLYPMLIIGTRELWGRIRKKRKPLGNPSNAS